MQVNRPQITFWDRLYFPSLVKGLAVTLRHLFRRKITESYPETKPQLYSTRYRGAPTLVRDPEGRLKCVACQLCEFVCPPRAIRVTPGSRPATGPDAHVEKQPEEFEIDMLRCIYCGLCEEVCPEQAIFLKDHCIMVSYRREELQLRKTKLLELGGTQAEQIWKWKGKA